MLSIVNMKEQDLFKFHQHEMKDCDCNLYGEYMLKEMSKNCPFKLQLFLLKFKILYNKLKLKNSEINPNWKTCVIGDCVPYEINKFNINKFNILIKYFDKELTFENCYDSNDNLLYIPVSKEDCKTVNINYPKPTKRYFEYYSSNQGKQTLLPLKHVQNNIHQFNVVVALLDQIIQNKNILNTVNFDDLNELAEKMKDTKYLDGLLSKNQSYHILKDAVFLDEMYKNPNTNFITTVKEFYLDTDIFYLEKQFEKISINESTN